MSNSTGNLPTYLYKLIPSSQPELLPNSLPETLPLNQKDIDDKFIHLSTSKQVPEIVNKHFAKEKMVYILRIKYETVKDIVRWEPSRGKPIGDIGDSHMFAHLDTDQWKKNLIDGVFVFDLGWLNLDH
ncbi:hypothetical protein F5887DRAFT_1287174 [Amanita rubescens]|nr:hypothetical protein F5887DRAFT_1287174 [Amanita rubescens]